MFYIIFETNIYKYLKTESFFWSSFKYFRIYLDKITWISEIYKAF